MDSWWDLGQVGAVRGPELQLDRVTCAFCGESGNFENVFHAEKKKANSSKVLNFETLKCLNCAGYVMCLWSAAEGFGGGAHHGYKVLPWPLRIDRHPDEWPAEVGRYWIQAKRSLADENWDAAALMARSSLQIALRDHGAVGRNLYREIESLGENGHLPKTMVEWAHTVRELGNDSAHPEPGSSPTQPQDASDIVAFLDYLLQYLYTLPKKIQQYRERRA